MKSGTKNALFTGVVIAAIVAVIWFVPDKKIEELEDQPTSQPASQPE